MMSARAQPKKRSPLARPLTKKHIAMIQAGGEAWIWRHNRKEQWIWDFAGNGCQKSFRRLWQSALISCKWDTIAGTAFAFASERGQKVLLEKGITFYFKQGVRHDITA